MTDVGAVGWAGTVGQFLDEMPSVTSRLAEAHTLYYSELPGRSQRTSWHHEVDILQSVFARLPQARDWGLVMEYELPFEGGRRADKIAIAADNVIVMEFKDTEVVKQADLDQVRAYARDLADYHSGCRDRRVEPVLVLAKSSSTQRDIGGTTVVGFDGLPHVLSELAGVDAQISLETLLAGTYAPLPSLVEAARRVFRDEPLPAIRRAQSAHIPELISWLKDLCARAEERKERHLVLITGVPGSGKTLVGLQFVHEYGTEGQAPAVLLSGNGPLVELLQHVLKSRVFVRPMRNFILEFGIRKRRAPPYHVLVFDEAQRAWDQDYVKLKHNVELSEPDMLVQIASQIPDWAVVICLVGEGQEIHLGEESGIQQWAHALARAAKSFSVHLPEHLGADFPRADKSVNALLNLTLSLRTHRAKTLQEWVNALLSSDLERARPLGLALAEDGYDLYVTQHLERAKAYARGRYSDAPEKRFGLLASAKAANLPVLGIRNEFLEMRKLRIGPWFSATPSDAASCCQLNLPATEFQCQGLELDLPILCWGDDLRWNKTGWTVSGKPTRSARDSNKLRMNAYRVLMTRGRDGMVVYVPHNLPDEQQSQVTAALRNAGARDLKD